MVNDGCDVLVMAPVADLVDADVSQVIEAVLVRIEVAGQHTSDDCTDGSPGDAHELGDSGLAALLGEEGSTLFEGQGEVAASVGPGHLLGLYRIALWTANTPNGTGDVNGHPRQIQVAPLALTSIVNPLCSCTALSTMRCLATRGDMDGQAVLSKLEVLNDNVLQGENGAK
ncbi:MAG: hypothetical protein ACI8X5_001934 [Planctomycetota bacterium]|jgi:hypothetical protein